MDTLTYNKRCRTHDIAVRPGFTTLYDLIAAVGDVVAPGDEAWIAPTVRHVLRSGHARFLQDIDTDDIDWQEAELAWSDTTMVEEVPVCA